MKICYVNHITPSVIYGGAERVVLEEAKMMTDSGNEALIVSMKHDENLPNATRLYDGKIRNHLIPYVAHLPSSTLSKGIDVLSSLYNPRPIAYLRKLLVLEKPDIVHIHQLGRISVCALKGIKQLGLRIVQTFHGCYFECPLGSLSKRSGALCNRKHMVCRFYEKLYFKLMKSCDLIIAISPHIKERLVELGYDSRRIRLIPNSIAIKQPKPISRKDGKTEILFVGRMTKVKGVDILIKALSRVKGEYVASLIGTGEQLPYYKSLAHRLRVSATFLGKVSDETLSKYYERAHVVVVPSLFPELCSMVVLEAMSYGKPVVASDIGGNPYFVLNDRTGYLFCPGDEEELAERIDDLICNERTASKMSTRALRFARKFSSEIHSSLLSEAYREVLDYGKSS